MTTHLDITRIGNQVVTTVRHIERDGTERDTTVSACDELRLEVEQRSHETVLAERAR